MTEKREQEVSSDSVSESDWESEKKSESVPGKKKWMVSIGGIVAVAVVIAIAAAVMHDDGGASNSDLNTISEESEDMVAVSGEDEDFSNLSLSDNESDDEMETDGAGDETVPEKDHRNIIHVLHLAADVKILYNYGKNLRSG